MNVFEKNEKTSVVVAEGRVRGGEFRAVTGSWIMCYVSSPRNVSSLTQSEMSKYGG